MKDLVNKLYNEDCIAFMKRTPNASINIIYTDVPYLLGSEYVIDNKGHYIFKGSGADFMSQWKVFDGRWWDTFFKEAFRVLKPGGYFLTHQIDRQADLHTYYARRNGFYPIQKLYWLFIDSFPKGVDVGLKLDKKLGVERELVSGANTSKANASKEIGMVHHTYMQGMTLEYDKTKATSEVAKKYDGYKYGVAPYKQVLEEILVFWKQPDDNVPTEILNFERQLEFGRPTKIHPSIMNIKDTRVQASRGDIERWTPQLLVDTRIIPTFVEKFGHNDSHRISEVIVQIPTLTDSNWNYVKKATVGEKEWGLDNFMPSDYDPKTKRKNNHPSPKPLALCKWVLNLFKIPNPEEMIVYDPFSGQGSIPLAAKQLGMQWIGTELDEEYFKLADAKLTYKPKEEQGDLF